MTIDERLEFLLQSTESLHASIHELHGAVSKQAEETKLAAENNKRLHRAMLRAMEGYLREMSDGAE